MNINSSEVEIRQVFSATEEAAAALQSMAVPQKAPARAAEPQPEVDPKSQAAVSAADRQTAKDTAAKISKDIQANDTSLKIRLVEDSEAGVQVEIVNKSSNKVVRKIPQDELIKLSASIKQMTGVLLNKAT